jgi:hypothetical protein
VTAAAGVVAHPINTANNFIDSTASSAKTFAEGVAVSTNEEAQRQLNSLYGQDVTSAVRIAMSAQGAVMLGSALGVGKATSEAAKVAVKVVGKIKPLFLGTAEGAGAATSVPTATVLENLIPDGIHLDPEGVYGFLPNEGSRYWGASNDFTDSVFVERNRKIRIGYLSESAALQDAIDSMRGTGYASESIATRVVLQRNSQKLEARALMTPLEVQALEAGNLKRYGDGVGPTPHQLFSKYGDWETVIKKSMEKDPAINLLLGLPPNH